MKKLLYLMLLLIILIGCKETATSRAEQTAALEDTMPATDVALQFINSYVKYLNDSHADLRWDEWIAMNPYVTQNFKKLVRVLFDEGKSHDPELGLGFDPILDTQDYPHEFEIEFADAKTGIVIVRGKNCKEFRLAIKLKQEKGKWLVDGSGVVNVPEEKRVTR